MTNDKQESADKIVGSTDGVAAEVKLGQYRCEMCNGVFDFGWPDDEAKAEAKGNGLNVDDCGIVCDDCYNKTPWGIAAQVGRGG